MGIAKYIAVIVCAIVVLVIAAPFFQERTPEAYVAADNLKSAQYPVATAAALKNRAEEIRVNVVVPAQATAEAASILANNQQRIDEYAHQQALRHAGEMNAIAISNTMQQHKIEADFTAQTEGIKANSAKQIAESNADAARASAGAWRDTVTYGGLAIGSVVLLLGGTLAIVTWLSTRAKIIEHPLTGPILIAGGRVTLLGNITTPMLLTNGAEMGSNVLPLVAQRQAFALIGKAKAADVPELTKAAQHATAQTVQAAWTPTALSDSAVQALPAGANDQAVMRVPTMAELLRTWRPARQQMLLGVDRGGRPIYCALEDLLSTGIIGRPKTGKSTLLRFIYLQCRLIGAQVFVWDLHLTVAGDLPGANAHTELEDINRSAEEVCRLLDRRIKSREYNTQPLMIMADEFNLLAPNSMKATEAIGRIILEGRKVNVFSMISGQGLPAHLFGGSTARDALSSRFVMHTTTRQASMVGLDHDCLPWVVDLKPGTAIVDGPIDPTVLSIPNTTEADLQMFVPAQKAASILVSAPLPADFPMVSREARNTAETSAEESAEAGKDNLIRDLLLQGKSQREIIAEVYGQYGGRGYQEAARELNDILRRLVK